VVWMLWDCDEDLDGDPWELYNYGICPQDVTCSWMVCEMAGAQSPHQGGGMVSDVVLLYVGYW